MGRSMSTKFQRAIVERRLLRFPRGKDLVAKEIEAARDDLKEAQDRFQKKRFKYATVTGYYAMFHAARALIYSKGYREKSHYYLLVALQSLFVEKGLLEKEIVEEFHSAMVLREEADYHGEFTEEGAELVIASAERFLEKAKDILR